VKQGEAAEDMVHVKTHIRRESMKRALIQFLVMIPLLVFSGCILSTTPPDGPISLTWGTSQEFSVRAWGTIQWYIDDVAQPGETSASYTFQNHPMGTYQLMVKVQMGTSTPADRQWTITVGSPPSTVPTAISCDEITNAGLVCSLVQSCSETVSQGEVISQSPEAGEAVPAGATVTLTVSSGTCLTNEVAVPAATACADLEAAGLVCETTQSCSNTALIGTVISQSPEAGTMVQPGTTVNLIISTGPCTVEIEVPIVTSCDDVETEGFVCSRTRLCSNTVPLGSVITQSPEAGTMVLPGSTIQLTLSTGLCGATVPDATTCEEIEAAGLVCRTVLYCSNTVTEDGFIGLSPPPGTGVSYGSTVNRIISSGLCQVLVPTATTCEDITNAGLLCSQSTTCSNTVSEGEVISQNPTAGTLVEPGSTVTLTVSSGVCAEQLPTPQNVQATDVVLTSTTNPLLNHNLNDRIRVTWSAVDNATTYYIYSSNTSDGTYTLEGSATAPDTSYDVMQTETLNLPTLPETLTTETMNAYEAAARPVLNDFKNYKYFKVRACSTSPLYSCSELSSYDQGRIDYTLEEFFNIAKLEAGNPLTRVMIQDPSVGLGTNETYYDPCGDGNVHFTVTQSGFSGLLTITLTNYIDSLNYIDLTSTIDCSGTRRMIMNGTASGTVSLSGNGTLTGSINFTGNFAGKFTNVSIPIANQEPGMGTTSVVYNGETVNGHAFGL
jgi:beta-lactam-binding protein with PASTA domain